MKRGHRYTVGQQPCQALLRGDANIAAMGNGNRCNVHQCPVCEGNRTWCDNCHTDHHDGGWETCKAGAYADPPEEDDDARWQRALANKRELDRLERAAGNPNPIFKYTDGLPPPKPSN